MKTVLVTGASGLLGREVARAFASRSDAASAIEWNVVGTAHSRAGGALRALDLLDGDALDSLVAEVAPDAIIHCAAERRPDVGARDPAAMRRLNVDATGRLAAAAKRCGAWMVLVSTDYVFDGANPPYAEDAATNPLNDYGRSKRDAELAMWAEADDAAVFRVPILFGPTCDTEESAVTAGVVRALFADPPKRRDCDAWAVRHPTCTTDVAAALRALADMRMREGASDKFRGNFHFSSPETMTKYDMAVELAKFYGRDPSILNPLPTQLPGAAPRPHDSTLACARLDSLGISPHTPFIAALAASLPRSF